MMIISRYLLTHYLKVQFFSVFSFLAILLTTRLQEIAHFAALGAPKIAVFLFTLYQIPYVLPIAIPIACLISSIVLIQRLSSFNELTALRASGRSLKSILAPILFASIVIASINFYIVSELATQSHLATRILEKQLRSISPLVLLHNKHLSDLKGLYVHSLSPDKEKDQAHDLILAVWNKSNRRISLLFAKELTVQQSMSEQSMLLGKNFTLITGQDAEKKEGFDNVAWENIKEIKGSVEDFTYFLRNSTWHLHSDYLKMSLLIVHVKRGWQSLQEGYTKGESPVVIKRLKKQFHKSVSEFSRRISLTLSVVAFTLMGAAFGISIGRYAKQKRVYFVVGLATLYLVCFFLAKGRADQIIFAMVLYMAPLFIVSGCSIFVLYKTSRGIE